MISMFQVLSLFCHFIDAAVIISPSNIIAPSNLSFLMSVPVSVRVSVRGVVLSVSDINNVGQGRVSVLVSVGFASASRECG